MTLFIDGGGGKLPGGWDGSCRQSLEHLDLPLEVGVGHAGHHHHVLGQPRLAHLLPGSMTLESAGLLEPSVPHLDLLDLVPGLRQLGHEPGVLHHGGDGVGPELLDVSVGEAALVGGRVLDEVPLPVSGGESCVLRTGSRKENNFSCELEDASRCFISSSLNIPFLSSSLGEALRPHGLKLRVTFESRVVTQRLELLVRVLLRKYHIF